MEVLTTGHFSSKARFDHYRDKWTCNDRVVGSDPFKAFEPLTNFAKIGYSAFKWRVSMATMNVSLPDPMKDWVEAQARTGRYSNASDYVRDLIRRDQTRNDKIAAMQSFVEAGLESGVGVRSKDELFAEAMARASKP
jgi:antitoxin ParD1/3/4